MKLFEISNQFRDTPQTFTLVGIPGDGRGGLFINALLQFVVQKYGCHILSWRGYDNEEDEEWEDFGSQFYDCKIRGTLEQVWLLIEMVFYSDQKLTHQLLNQATPQSILYMMNRIYGSDVNDKRSFIHGLLECIKANTTDGMVFPKAVIKALRAIGIDWPELDSITKSIGV